jgi:hypothetical protein
VIGAPNVTQPAASAATPVTTRNSLRAFMDHAPSAPTRWERYSARTSGVAQESNPDRRLIHGLGSTVRR